jgi:hypothetical protein
VEPEQHGDGDGEMERQIGAAEQVELGPGGVSGVLHASFDEQARRPLERSYTL